MKKLVQATLARAQASKAILKLTTEYEVLRKEGLQYVVFKLNEVTKPVNITPKTEKVATKPIKFDPFAEDNLERDLFVQEIGGTHNLILNKFNVVDEHVRILY